MIKREMKINLKNFIIWLLLLIFIFSIVFLMYPSMLESNNINMINDMVKIFPKEILVAFNMDLSSLTSVYGWLKSEGFIILLLLTGCFSGILGSNIVLKEEDEKTIEYLNSLPISRCKILVSKVIVGIIYVVLLIFAIGIFNYIGLSISGDFDKKQYILLSIVPLFPSLVIFFLCLFLSIFARKTKKTLTISLAVVFLSYMLHTFSNLSTETEFLKYFSVFTLSDIRNVITTVSINPLLVTISICLSIVFFILSIMFYEKKDLV